MEPATSAGEALWALVMTVENLAVMIAAAVLVGIAKRNLWRREGDAFDRLLPLLPVVLCCLFLWIPGLEPHFGETDAPIGTRLVLGIVLGALTLNAHSLLKRIGLGFVVELLGLGNGKKIDDKPGDDAEPTDETTELGDAVEATLRKGDPR